jgi:hypothetical protein
MANGIEAEISAIQAGSAHTMTWLRGDYLPSPLPKTVEDRLATLISRFDAPRELARTGRAPRRSPAPETKKLSLTASLVVCSTVRIPFGFGVSIAAFRCDPWLSRLRQARLR